MKRCGASIVAAFTLTAWSACAQQTKSAQPLPAPTTATQKAAQANATAIKGDQSRPVKPKDRRRAAKLYLAGSKLFEKEQFEPAMHDYESAAQLDPGKPEYGAAALLARSHAVTALIQEAAKARTKGNPAAARAAIAHARQLDPSNPQVAEHLSELADDALARETRPLYEAQASTLAEEPPLEPSAGLQSFHLRLDRRQMAQRVYKAYGIDATVDQSVSAVQARLDLDNVGFLDAINALHMVANTFAVPLDAHRVLVARDTRENRQQFERHELETVYLPGLNPTEMNEVSNVAKNIFGVQQVNVQQNLGTVTLRATSNSLNAFNTTVRDLVSGRSQVLLDVQIIQLAHSRQHNTGVQLPQQVTAFNLFTEEQAILNANQALVQQIISSGLAAPGDTLAILGILLASGQVSSSLFTNGIAIFGGGLTLSGVSPKPVTFNLSLNSSDTRELDHVRLRLADGEDQTIRSGTRYPILQASFSSSLTNGINIPGLTSAGNSGGLSGLLSSVSGQTTQIPQIQYQDIGLTLKTNPKVMRSGDVALTLDLKITSLAGSSLDSIPVLNNRSYSGVVTLKSEEGAVLVSELDKTESRALSGTPGLSEVPGLNNVSDKDVQTDYATLLVILTPHLVRGPQAPLNVQPIRVERSSQTFGR